MYKYPYLLMKKLPRIQIKNINRRLLVTITAIILLVPLLIVLLPYIKVWQARAAATIFWDGGGDGTSWSNALNWNTDVVPSPTDEVLIDTASTVNITDPITVTSLTLGKSDGSAATVLQFSYDAVTLGALTITGSEFRLNPGAIVRHVDYNGVNPAKVNIDVQTGNALILGSINVDARGYRAGDGPGQGTDGGDGGGGAAYGGNGGRAQQGYAGGTGYGVYTLPTEFGSGGGNRSGYASTGGHGGGVVKLSVGGTLTVTGTITADGNVGANSGDRKPGGGSGGSILITTGTITGNGIVKANGAQGGDSNYDGGSGGGGRIAIYYTTNTSSFSTLAAAGGNSTLAGSAQYGGAGTIYMKTPSQTNGDLIVSNNASGWSTNLSAEVPYTPLPNTLTLDNLTISKFANVNYTDTLTVGTTSEVSYYAYLNLTGTATLNTFNINNSSHFFSQSGSTTTYNTLNWTGGIITDNGGIFALVSGGSSLSIPTGSILNGNVQRIFANVTIDGTLTHSENFTTPVNKLDYIVTGNITVNSSGQINTNIKGYKMSEGPGAGGDSGGGGGGAGYGGNGSAGESGAAGSAYGSITQPTDLGSGGGYGFNGGGNSQGGGAIKLTVSGILTVNGTITANGGAGTNGTDRVPGGGSGGSIWITTGTLSGTGTITANGGNAQDWNSDGGAGGGGRIALYYTTNNATLAALTADGGRPSTA